MSDQDPQVLMTDIADGLEDGSLTPEAAATRLRAAVAQDIETLDDMEIDFDLEAPGPLGAIGALFTGAKSSTPEAENPVERALLKVVKLRDRNSALTIAGDPPAAADTEDYEKALAVLRDTLNAHLPDPKGQ